MKPFGTCSILFVLLFSIYSFSQQPVSQVFSELDLSKLDNFLLQDDSTNMIEYFIQKNSEIERIQPNGAYLTELGLIKKNYLALQQNIQKLSLLSSNEIDLRIRQYINFSESFSLQVIGKKSVEYYNKFQEEAKNGNKILALKYYSIALNRKILHIKSRQIAISDKLTSVERYVSQNDFVSADIMLRDINLETKSIAVPDSVKHKIEHLNDVVRDGVKKINQEHKLYRQTANFNTGSSVSVGASNIFFTNGIEKDQIWQLVSNINNTVYTYQIDKIDHSSGYFYTADFNRYGYGGIKFGVGYGYGKSTIKSINKRTAFSSDLDINYHSILIDGSYYFKKAVGLRPFTSLGLRELFLTRKELIYRSSPSNLFQEILRKENSTALQLIGVLGLEFLGDEKAKFAVQLHLLFHRNLQNSNIVGSYGASMGGKLSYLF